nr:JmjC domain-containing protein [Tanacetum cinerariifolium]
VPAGSGTPSADIVVLFLLVVHTVGLVPTGGYAVPAANVWYALTHRPTVVFDSLVKQFWATATVRTLEVGPSDIIATIDGNEVVAIGYPTDGSLTFYKAKLSPQWREHTPVREPSPVREPTPVRDPSPHPEQEPTPDSPNPPFPPPSLAASNEAPQTPAATAAGGSEDSMALTALSLKLDRCLRRVTTLETELSITKKVLGGAVLKLVTRVKRLEGLLQQRKRRLRDLGDDSSATAAGLDAETTMPIHGTSTTRRRLRKLFTSFVFAHVSETIPVGVRVPAAATTIPAGSSVDAVVHAAAGPSSSIPTPADKGKAPMVDDSLPADLLSEQERAQAETVASPTAHAPGMSDQRRRELDAAQLIYTEADWLDLLAKIATNSALSKQLLGDDVTKENMNERLGMLLLRKRRELAEQSWVKPMTKTQQRDYMRDFVKNSSASVYNQGWTMKKVKELSIAQLRLEFEYIQKHLERSNLLNFRRSTFHPKPILDAWGTLRIIPLKSTTKVTEHQTSETFNGASIEVAVPILKGYLFIQKCFPHLLDRRLVDRSNLLGMLLHELGFL